MFKNIVSLYVVFLFCTVSLFSIEEDVNMNFSSSISDISNKVSTRKKSLDEQLAQPVYPGRNYNFPLLEEETYHLLEKGSRGTKNDRLSVLRWCGQGRVLYCFTLLRKSLENTDVDIRNGAVVALGFLSLPQSVSILIELSKKEKDSNVFGNIVYALATSNVQKGESGVQIVLSALDSKDSFIVRRAVEGLAEIGDSSHAVKIRTLLDRTDISEYIRLEAYRTLIILERDNSSHPNRFVKFFESPDAFIRNTAALYSSELSLKEAFLPSQRAMLLESDPDVRKSLYKAYRTSQLALFFEEE